MIISGRKIARNVMAMATGEVPAAIATGGEASTEIATTELPEIVKTLQKAVRTFFKLFKQTHL